MALDWSCELPEAKRAALGERKPRATLVIKATEGEERLSIPAAVGRSMAAFAESDAKQPESRAELLYVLREKSDACAMARLGRLIDRRDYSRTEAAEKLRLDGYRGDCIDRVLERAQASNMIDDCRFAEVFIRSKLASGWGSMRIERELSRRGIEASELAGWPEEYFDPSDEPERAYELVSTRPVPSKNAYPKLMRFLVSRGFSMSAATYAVRRRLDEAAEDSF